MTLSKIADGTVYDPANGIDGVVRDLWIQDGKIVAAADRLRTSCPTRSSTPPAWSSCPAAWTCTPTSPGRRSTSPASCGPRTSASAPMVRRTPLTRSGTTGSVPSTFATGYLYAGLGYTTAFDAAIPPLGARHAHEEFHDTPVIDKGFFVLVGNNHYVLEQIAAKRAGAAAGLRRLAAERDQGLRRQARQPRRRRGLEAGRRQHPRPRRQRSSTSASRRGRSSRRLAQTAMDLGLPHPVHIHCNNLGLPGNWTTTLETMQALEGRRGPPDAHPVPQLRRRPGRPGHVLLARCPSWPSTSTPTRT